MPTLRWNHAALLAMGMVASCAGSLDPVTVDIGVHRVSFVIPEGWQRYDHGREQRLETSDGDIVLTDLGPVTADGFRPVIDVARVHLRSNRRDDARQILEDLLRAPSIEATVLPSAIAESLDRFRTGRPTAEVEASLDTILVEVDRLSTPDLSALASTSLTGFDHGPRRDVEREEIRNVDGRQARQIITWQRLTHDHRRWHLWMINRGHLLVIRTTMGRDRVLGPAFETVVGSLSFVGPDAYRTP
jgi:hypothetical protein